MVQVAVCGMRCIDLNNDTLKILGTRFSYNEKLTEEKLLHDCNRYSKNIKNIENEKPYTRRENYYFEAIAISKIVFQSFITTVPKHIINDFEKIQEGFTLEKLSS